MIGSAKTGFKRISNETFTCPIRTDDKINVDYWYRIGEDYVCSYCGSWRPDEFMELVQEITDNQNLIGNVSVNCAKGKLFVNRNWIKSNLYGATSFRLQHLTHNQLVDNFNKISNSLGVSRECLQEILSND